MACFQKAYSRSVLFIQSNMQEDEKKHLDTPQTLFTGLTLDRTTLCPMGSRPPVIGLRLPLFMPSADKEKACSVHPLQVRGRPLVAIRVGCGAKPCRELRRSKHSEQSGVLSWRMTHAWGSWLPGRRQGDRYTPGKRVHPLPVCRRVEDMLTPRGVGGIPQRVDARRWERPLYRYRVNLNIKC